MGSLNVDYVYAVDTTAAGDTFTGYFIAGLAEGRPLQECMRRASMASSISVTRPGAANAIPTRAEVAQALKGVRHPKTHIVTTPCVDFQTARTVPADLLAMQMISGGD